MRFLLDMGISPKTADFLTRAGHEASHLYKERIFRLRTMRPQIVNRYLEIILSEHHEALREGAILSVTDSKIRARSLPLGV